VRTALASLAVLAGAAFMFVAGLGLARLPDLYTRMHAATKPATVGVAAIMTAVALSLDRLPVTVRAALVAVFFLLTAPVAAHAIARSAHTRRVPLAPGTRVERGDGDGGEPGTADRGTRAAWGRPGEREREGDGGEQRVAPTAQEGGRP
jgi:multicomponent Na+:H+ antiporter subunit G